MISEIEANTIKATSTEKLRQYVDDDDFSELTLAAIRAELARREQAQAPQHTPSPELLRALDTLLSRDAEPTPTAISAMIHRANEQHASTIADLLTENARLRSLLADHVGLLRGQAEIARNQGYHVAASALEKAADEATQEAL